MALSIHNALSLSFTIYISVHAHIGTRTQSHSLLLSDLVSLREKLFSFLLFDKVSHEPASACVSAGLILLVFICVFFLAPLSSCTF